MTGGGGTIGDPRYDVALAIRPKDGVFQNSEDVEYFYEGYGGNRITKKEFDYFQSGGLYDFFLDRENYKRWKKDIV